MGRLRKGYKQTEVGVVPTDWDVPRIKDFSHILTGGTPSTSVQEYWGGDILWMSSGELNEKYVRDVVGRITQYGVDNSSTRPIPSHCVLIGLAGQGKTRGTAAINLVELCTNQSIAAIVPSSKHNPFYLYHLIDSKYNELRELSTGDGGRGGLNKKLLENLLVALPHPEEQNAVAEVLNDIDLLIEALDRKIAKKRAIKEGAMQQLLSGKKRQKGFTEPWVEKRFDEIGEFVSGNAFPIFYQGNQDGNYPFYKVSDFNTIGNESRLLGANNYISAETSKILSCNIIPTNSIIFAKIGAAIALERKKLSCVDCCIDNNLMAFLPAEGIDAEYIWYVFQTMRLWDMIEATALPSLSGKQIGSVSKHIPSTKKEQTAIAQILTDMDNEIGQLENERQKYISLKQGAMHQLLTGQIRLITDSKAQSVEKPQKPIPIAFKRSVWAAEIVDRLCDEPTFGHVKMEKMIFLTEHMCGVDIGSNYHRGAAGPYDNRAIRSIDSQLKKQNWFEVVRKDKGYRYLPMTKRGGHKDYFNRYYSEVQIVFDRVVNTCRSWNTERCEIVATLYSAWKDLGSNKKQYTDDDIINEVINNWNESKKRIPEDRWRKALGWMHENDFAPTFI